MKKWNLIVDVALCENCHNCTLAAKDEHVGNDFPGYAAPQPKRGHDWIRIERKVRGTAPMVDAAYLPTMCNHCDDAPCIKAGGRRRGPQARRRHRDHRSREEPGPQGPVDACPYGAICGTRSRMSRRRGFSMRICWMPAGRRPALRAGLSDRSAASGQAAR